MKQFTIAKKLLFSVLLLTAFSLVTTSCESPEAPFEAAAPAVQESLSGYGSCGSCPLPSTMSGSLPSQLYTNAWMGNLENCFEEDIADVGTRCQFRTGSTNTITENIDVYLQFSTNPANTLASFCSYFYQVGNALEYNRPTGNWLLYNINYMSHIFGSDYKINVTWRRYICEHPHAVKVK
jgi:hypothetical protein